jgi:hypothetical protein
MDGVTPVEKLVEKARAYYLTDRNTPLIGQLVTKLVSIYRRENGGRDPEFQEKLRPMMRWESDVPQENQYPNNADSLSSWAMAAVYEMFRSYELDVETFLKFCRDTKTLEGFIDFPMCAVPKVPVTNAPVVVDNDWFIPNTPVIPTSPVVKTPAINPVVRQFSNNNGNQQRQRKPRQRQRDVKKSNKTTPVSAFTFSFPKVEQPQTNQKDGKRLPRSWPRVQKQPNGSSGLVASAVASNAEAGAPGKGAAQ